MSNEHGTSDPLPYTQVDRAAKRLAAIIAAELGVTYQHAIGGLVEFWELCGDPRALERLVAAGTQEVVLKADDVAKRFRVAMGKPVDLDLLVLLTLLEPRPDKCYRVRGMSRFFSPIVRRLQAREAARLGGLASARARETVEVGLESAQPTAQPTPKREPSGEQPADSGQRTADSGDKKDCGSPPAPPPLDRKTKKTKKAKKARKVDKATDPRHAPLVKTLCDAFQLELGGPYGFTPRDAREVSNLLALGEPGEVEARWRRALRHTGFPTVRTLGELVALWNHWGQPTPSMPIEPDAPPSPSGCVACGSEGGYLAVSWGHALCVHCLPESMRGDIASEAAMRAWVAWRKGVRDREEPRERAAS
jgi:hypothetical protein